MSRTVQPAIAKLFLAEKSPGQSREFTWRLVRRRHRAFLLLPTDTLSARVSLTLYSAQRRRAKIWRALLPVLLNTPAAVIFQRLTYAASENSDLMRFLVEQSGVPFGQFPAPAIKFGGAESQKSRLVLLVCDQTNRPLKVIKLGLDAAGRAATDQEAGLLEKLPANTLGCIRLSGRLNTLKLSAFATDYFPGDSPSDDAGMEVLFHSWVNPGPAQAIETFAAWRALETEVAPAAPAAWALLRAVLAGKSLHSTLHHGDFAPWNIRAVNSQNLQVFDWERGNLQGIPGWDWFHFVVQTAVLARRFSAERVAAEVEELLRSPRFEKYAAATGMSPIVKPLVLAYLLHHRWVVRPLEGGRQVEELFELLAARWELAPQSQGTATGPASAMPAPTAARSSLWADACGQLLAAWSQLANVFWEPTLTAASRPPLSAQLKSGWPLILLCSGWLAAAANLQYAYANHLTLLPVFALPCLLAAWRINRRWGTLFAGAAAVLGPLVAMAKDPASHPADLLCWNTFMRFVTFQMCVFLSDRIRRREEFFGQFTTTGRRPASFADNWAVILASALGFFLIAWGDIWTGPRVSVLPLYLFPAMLITLFLNLRWGTFTVLLGALVSSFDEYASKYNASIEKAFGWNFPMRFLMLFLVILLLDRLRHKNVLFSSRKLNGGFKSGQP
jgi:hypothetical protein